MINRELLIIVLFFPGYMSRNGIYLPAYIIHVLFTGQGDNAVPSWELRVEGRLLDDTKNDPNKVRHLYLYLISSLMYTKPVISCHGFLLV